MPTGFYQRQQVWVDHIEIGEVEDCWRWLASTDSKGYPQVRKNYGTSRAHRLIAALFGDVKGPVHHVCGNRWCVNPSHLLPLSSPREHFQHHIRKVCKRGHDLTDSMNVTLLSNGTRRCRPCHALRERERYRGQR